EPDARGSERERVFEGHGSSAGSAQRVFGGWLPDAPSEPDDGKADQREDDPETESRQHRQHRESRGGKAGEGKPDDGEDGNAAAGQRAGAGGETEHARHRAGD